MYYCDWLDVWLENYVKATAKSQTLERYTAIANLYIKPKLGNCYIEDLNPIELQEFLIGLMKNGCTKSGKGLSANSVNSIITVLQGSLHTAFQLGMTKDYIGDKIKRPKVREKKVLHS